MRAIARPAAIAPAISTAAARPRFAGLVRGELRKLIRHRPSWALPPLGAVILVLVGLAVAADPASTQALRSQSASFLQGAGDAFRTAIAMVVGALLLVLSARLVAVEYDAGTLRVLVARGVTPLRLLTAKLAALAITGVAVVAAGCALAAAFAVAMALRETGGLAPLRSVPAYAWHALQGDVAVLLLSAGTCILLGAAASAAGRSMAFGVAAAMGFFPADNVLAYVSQILHVATGVRFWLDLPSYLLGPNLNHLPSLLGAGTSDSLAMPLVPVDLRHALAVIGVFALAFLGAACATMWRREVHE